MEGKHYMWPVPADHSEVVLCGSTHSLPCRVCFYIVKMFKLPVDICGVAFPKDVYSPEALEINPIHSMPWLQVYTAGAEKPVCINGSEAIIPFFVAKFRDLIPESFAPSDALKSAMMMQKVVHISGTCYRATTYQYVYPRIGLMSECQYDLCKRDFALDIVEQWAKEKDSDFFEGSDVTVADLYWYSLWMSNSWVQDDAKFSKIEWRHKDVIDKYPASKRIIEAVGKLAVVKEVDDLSIGEGAPSANLVNSTGLFGMIPAERPGNARKFNFGAAEMLHPSMVGMSDKKADYDMPLNL